MKISRAEAMLLAAWFIVGTLATIYDVVLSATLLGAHYALPVLIPVFVYWPLVALGRWLPKLRLPCQLFAALQLLVNVWGAFAIARSGV